MYKHHYVMGVVDYSTDTVRFKIRKHPLYLNIFVCFFFVSILLFCILLFNLWFIVCDAISVLFWFLFCFCTFHDGLPMTIWLHWLVMCNSFLYWHGHWLGKIKNFLVVVVVQQFMQMQGWVCLILCNRVHLQLVYVYGCVVVIPKVLFNCP